MLTPEIREQIQKSLAPYGAELNADDQICKGDRNTLVKVVLIGKRLQYIARTGKRSTRIVFRSPVTDIKTDIEYSISTFIRTYWPLGVGAYRHGENLE